MDSTSPYKYEDNKQFPEHYVDESGSEINSFTAIIAEGERRSYLISL
jgi:hypothetical protein